MRFFLLILFFLTVYNCGFAQNRYTVSGIIKSSQTGETIIGATISANNGNEVVSNEYGFYSTTLDKNLYTLKFSAIGYDDATFTLNISKDTVLNIFLLTQSKELENITVTTTRSGRTVSGTQMGVEKLTMEEIKKIPMIFGERDILKAIQLLPGIKAAGDGNSGFYVRGGNADQNLILLDEANVYNASHLMGFFSTFNPDVVKDILVYKGGMPAQYGGRLSSVLDIKMNEGNNKDFMVSGGLGLISSKLNIEGPIQKDKSSFLLSGRRTYADLFLFLSKDTNLKRNKLYFYDLNGKMNYTLGKKDKLYLSGYTGRDYLKLHKQFGLDWGNVTGTLRWNHIFNSKLFSNTSFIYSDFDYKISIENPNNDLKISSQIKDLNLKQEFQWYAGSKHTVRFGLNSIFHEIKPGEVTSSGSTSFNNLFLQKRYSWDNAFFMTDTWKASTRFNFTYGLRFSSFGIFGPGDFYNINSEGIITDTLKYKKGELVKNYFNLEPRLAASFLITPSASIKASYVRNVQNLHLISNSTASTPTDKWIASSNIIKPEISDLYAIGWYKNLNENNYELTLEAYYKSMQNQIDYRSGADIYTNNAIESQLLFGEGRAYGLETLFKKKYGKFTGWLSYTLSKTERRIDGINDKEWYPARQDRTHDIAIVANYQINKNWNLSANWVYYTGDAVTFPVGKYVIDNQMVFYYTKRNAYRMPDYHRLDIGATRQWKGPALFFRWLVPKTQWHRFNSELAISLYNAYGRRNAYFISFQQNDKTESSEAVKTSLFRYVPSISYNFKF